MQYIPIPNLAFFCVCIFGFPEYYINGIIQFIVFEVCFLSSGKMCIRFIYVACLLLFYCWSIFYCMDVPCSCLSISIWKTFGWLWGKNPALNNYVQVLAWNEVSISFELILRSVVAGSYGTYMFNFMRNCQAIFQSDYHF